MKDIDLILQKQIEKIKISVLELEKIKKNAYDFCIDIEKKLKKNKINAEVFIGGSLAKNTLIKTDENKYDVDIFVRFSKEYGEKISEILRSILGDSFHKIHGSRDYYQKNVGNVILEVIPVIKVKNPLDSENITDLSYFHVKYVLEKIKKNKKLCDEIMLSKSFSHSQDCYGAESYIQGFSGYSLELLIINYGSFINFLKAISESNDEKIIIDSEKMFKNKEQILMELNESKLQSPIILVDPTFRDRNALSGLSKETFDKFKKASKEFLKNPSDKFFIRKNIENEFEKFNNAKKIKIITNKQAGDIAGTKSKKFFNFFVNRISKEFIVKKSGFNYNEDQNTANIYLILDKKNEEVIKGPPITMIENVKNFKRMHGDAFIKNQICYAKLKHELKFEDFFKKFLEKDKKIINEMGIKEIKIE